MRESAAKVLRGIKDRLDDNLQSIKKQPPLPGHLPAQHSILIGNDEADSLVAGAVENAVAFNHTAQLLSLRTKEISAVLVEEECLSQRSRYLLGGVQITLGYAVTAFTKAASDGAVVKEMEPHHRQLTTQLIDRMVMEIKERDARIAEINEQLLVLQEEAAKEQAKGISTLASALKKILPRADIDLLIKKIDPTSALKEFLDFLTQPERVEQGGMD